MYILRFIVILFLCIFIATLIRGLSDVVDGAVARGMVQQIILCVIAIGVWLPKSDSRKEPQ